jgi:DNA-binding beta-propeller fold protein YncE
MRALRKNPDERFHRAGEMGQALLNALRSEAPAQPRPVQLNVVTCRGCGTPIPAGKSACPKCGRLAAPPGAQTGPGMPGPGMQPGMAGAGTGPRPMPGRPGTGSLNAPPGMGGPGGTGNLGGQRAGFPPRPTTSPLNRPGRPISGARHLFSFGSQGYNPGELNQPRGLALDGNRQLWVADTENGRVQVVDTQGKFVREIRAGNTKDSFRFPRAVAISPVTNKVYVIDEQDFRIFVLDLEGRPLSVWDRRRNMSEQAVAPGRLTISANGTIFVSEPNHRRVMVYTPAHGFTTALGAGGELQSPGGVAVGPKASLAVLDYGSSRVQIFDQKGKGISTFGRRGVGPGEFSVPRDLVVDRAGFAIVADTLNHRIQVFDPQGQFLTAFGQKGKQEGAFQGPEGLALSAEDVLYVSDRGNGRISVFQLERG